MRVVFMGYQPWGNVTLRAIIEAGHEIPLVVTHPPSENPYEAIWPDSVTEIASEQGTNCLHSTHADRRVAEAVAQAKPEVIFASNWRTWIAPEVYELASLGAFNIHDALLPRYGGLAPLNWAVANRETETGVTVHFLAPDIDLGDIAVQQRVEIGPEDTATDLLHRTLPLFGDLAIETLARLEAGTLERRPQDPRDATFFHRRTDRDGLIDWTAPPEVIRALVRAQSDPYPNAYTFHRSQRLRIKSTSVPARIYRGTPGRVFCHQGNGVIVVCGSGAGPNQAIVVDIVQAESGPPVAAAEYFQQTGEQLGGLPPEALESLRTHAAV